MSITQGFKLDESRRACHKASEFVYLILNGLDPESTQQFEFSLLCVTYPRPLWRITTMATCNMQHATCNMHYSLQCFNRQLQSQNVLLQLNKLNWSHSACINYAGLLCLETFAIFLVLVDLKTGSDIFGCNFLIFRKKITQHQLGYKEHCPWKLVNCIHSIFILQTFYNSNLS